MGDSYDQKDAEGFIRILGLPARSRARLRLTPEDRGGEVKMWSGRFRQPLDADFERWQRSFRLRPAFAAGRAGGQPRSCDRAEGCRSAVLRRLIASRGPEADRREGCGVTGISRRSGSGRRAPLCRKTAGGADWRHGIKLHSGRSRNEQIATDLRLYVRAAIDQIRAVSGSG